jgi:hypothetical protein
LTGRKLYPPKFTSSEPDVKDDVGSELSFDVDLLLEKSGQILAREIRNIMIESSRGKLNAASSRDLVAYLKLLNELKNEQQDALANMSDEELRKLALEKLDKPD